MEFIQYNDNLIASAKTKENLLLNVADMEITVIKKVKRLHLEIRKRSVDIMIKGFVNIERGVNIIIQDKYV